MFLFIFGLDRKDRRTRIIQMIQIARIIQKNRRDRIIRKNRNIRITRKARMTPGGTR